MLCGCVAFVIDDRTGLSQEAASKERALLYQSAFESANDVIIYYHVDPRDPNGPRILYANQKFVEETGYTVEEAMGRYSSILFGARTNIRGIEANRERLVAGESTVLEIQKYRKDGSTYWTEASTHPLRDTFGRYTFWVSIERNTTARHEMQEHMHLLQLALESAHDMIVINEVSNDVTSPWNIVYLNQAFEDKTGWNRSELPTLEKVFGENPNRQQSENARRAVLNGESTRVKNAFYTKDGKEFWVEGVIQPVLGEEERPIHAITIYREIEPQPRTLGVPV